MDVTVKRNIEIPYDKIDPEVRTLVKLINRFPGLVTTGSCIGHDEGDCCHVGFTAESQDNVEQLIDALPFFGSNGGFMYNTPCFSCIWIRINNPLDEGIIYVLQIDGSPYQYQRQIVGKVEGSLRDYLTTL